MTQESWERASEVTEVAPRERDTEPAPPPSDAEHPLPERKPGTPADWCQLCHFGDHDPACPLNQAVAP